MRLETETNQEREVCELNCERRVWGGVIHAVTYRCVIIDILFCFFIHDEPNGPSAGAQGAGPGRRVQPGRGTSAPRRNAPDRDRTGHCSFDSIGHIAAERAEDQTEPECTAPSVCTNTLFIILSQITIRTGATLPFGVTSWTVVASSPWCRRRTWGGRRCWTWWSTNSTPIRSLGA